MRKVKKTSHSSSYAKNTFAAFRKNPAAMTALVILLTEILIAFLIPPLLHLDPYTAYKGCAGAAPTQGHILGFDTVGRDLFSRLIIGGRTTLLVGFTATLIGVALGVPLGMLAGYYRGICETVIMRIADVFLALPSMIVILVVVAVFGSSLNLLVLLVGLMSWPKFARVIHGKILSVREEEYVEAARSIGTSDFVILLRYVLPNAFAPVLVQATFSFAKGMMFEAGLSFLGMGVRPPIASWGNILYDAQSLSVLLGKPWVWFPAGMMFIITVLSINLVGDGVRRALDPKAV